MYQWLDQRRYPSSLGVVITGSAAKDMPEYWSVGVLDVIKPEVDKPRFRQSSAVILALVNVFEQNKLC